MLAQTGKAGFKQAADATADIAEFTLGIFANDIALGGNQFLGERRLQQGQTTAFQQGIVAIDLGHQAFLRRNRKNLLGGQRKNMGAAICLFLDLGINFIERFQLVPLAVDLVHHHHAAALGRAATADMLFPDRQIGLGDAGIGSQNEEHGVRIGELRQGQFRFSTNRIQTRRIENNQALLEQRMGKIDHGMAPARHFNQAIFTDPVKLDFALAYLKTQAGGFFRRHASGFADVAQRVLHGIRRLGIQGHDGPFIGKTLVFGDARIGRARLDRQQLNTRLLAGIKQQLSRAHRRATGRGWQHPVAVIGKENRVDQFRFATRELSNEGHIQTIFTQSLKQLGKTQIGLTIRQLVFIQPALKLTDMG